MWEYIVTIICGGSFLLTTVTHWFFLEPSWVLNPYIQVKLEKMQAAIAKLTQSPFMVIQHVWGPYPVMLDY